LWYYFNPNTEDITGQMITCLFAFTLIHILYYIILYIILYYIILYYIILYSLTAIWLTHGGSSTVPIYTKTIHRTIQWNTIPRTEHT